MLRIHGDAIKASHSQSWLGPAPWIVVPPPGPKAWQTVARDRRVTGGSASRVYPLVVRRAQGTVVEDVDGNRYLDFAAGAAVGATGHCHPQVVAAIEAQCKSLLHTSHANSYFEPLIRLSEKLAAAAPGKHAKRVHFATCGSTAVEAAMKLARYNTRRKTILAFHGSNHGRTMGALALTSDKACQKQRFGPLVPMVEHATYGDIGTIREIFKRVAAPDEVAAIFVEPIQGGGGHSVSDAEFLPDLRTLCDQHGILLIVDEVQTGMGRTGKMFCCSHYGVVPDMILTAVGLASGLPMGAVIARDSLFDGQPDLGMASFSGNPLACVAALATIDLLERHFTANAAKLYPIAVNKLETIASRRKCVANPRGLGLMLAVDIVKDRRRCEPDGELRDRIVAEAFNRGVLLLPCGEAAIRFCPPLSVNRVQLEVGLDVVDEAIATVAL